MKAVIFDMDGVIADTQKIHGEIEANLLRKQGIEIEGHEISARFAGVRDFEMFETILKENGKTANVDELCSVKRKLFGEAIEKGVDSIEGAVELIHELHAKGVPLAVASSSNRKWIEQILTSLAVFDHFEVIVAGSEVPHGKPAPDIFLKCAELLKMTPENCIVIEDGISGVFGAQKAEMKVIGFGKAVENIADFSTHNMQEVGKIVKGLLRF
ncbi:MAG: HAD family phosphatase [Candidatus Altiarchaeota archaeon]|nr:HAD family phosphatase [Candidatus Altiarchaeota archaeon]